MPIRPEDRFFYPIDWPELSRLTRFERAQGRCQQCRRPHGARIVHLSDGRWYDAQAGIWRDGAGKPAGLGEPVHRRARLTTVYLATAHVEHDTSRNSARDLAAWCQRCHINHDRPEHIRRRKAALFRCRALGDLFLGRY